jgi:hypothetical protein
MLQVAGLKELHKTNGFNFSHSTLMRDFSLKAITVACLAILLFSESTMAGLFFSTPGFAGEIDVQASLLNEQDASRAVLGEAALPATSPAFPGLVHLVVQIENRGNRGAWGELRCSVQGFGEVCVAVPHLTGNMTSPARFVIPLSGMLRPPPSAPMPCDWHRLSSK